MKRALVLLNQAIRWQDTALYNFSVGLGQDPMDQAQLDFLRMHLVQQPRVGTAGADSVRLFMA